MSFATMIVLLPLGAVLCGLLAGGVLGRFATPRAAGWALAAFCLLMLGLIVRLVFVTEGNEAMAFGPFVTLTAGLFPALFGAVLGWLGGRALARRAD